MKNKTSTPIYLIVLAFLALVSLTACGGGGGGGGGAAPPPPPPPAPTGVALFANTTYVDYLLGQLGAEATHMEAALRSQGHTVTPFTGITAAEITAALADKKVFVLPDLEKSALDAALTAAARTAISDFVNAGGILISVFGAGSSNLDVLNLSFGYALVPGSFNALYTRDAAAAVGTAFANCGPTTLGTPLLTRSVTTASLPAGAKAIYTGAAGSAVVGIIPQGSGSVVILGWDFFNAKPIGTQDGGWWHVLYRAARLDETLPTVALLSADIASLTADMVTKLESTCQFAAIDTFDVETSTPTLAQLQAYPSVLVNSDNNFADNVALGDVLADYVDGGGGVVLSHFSFFGGNLGPAGRFASANYFAIPGGSSSTSGIQETGDFTLGFSSHPALSGVASFDGGTASFQPNTSNVVGGVGATRMANWSDGSTPLVVTRQIGTARRIDLGFYPASSDASASFWDATTDGEHMMANALTWAANLPQPAVQTFSKVDGSVIPDLGTLNSSQVVSGAPTSISKVTVTLDITHDWDTDLDIFLEAPDGTLIELTTDNGAFGDNYTNTVFDDAAATAISGLIETFAPFTGSFIPEQALAGLIGKDANGTWILRVTDDFAVYAGVLNSWSINVR